jgi:L-arabinose isomerase
MLLVAEGQSVPGSLIQIGNTNSRYKFLLGAKSFVNKWNSHGPSHHCAVGVGHIGSKIAKFGALLLIDVVQIC